MRRLIALLAWLPLVALGGPLTADDLAARLGQRPVLRAEFVQEKELAAFKKPLVTRGRLVFVRNQGVLWQIDSPLRVTYALSEGRLVEIGDDGRSQVRSAQELPGLAQVGRIFRALLGAQTAALTELFVVAAEGSPEAWRLVLTPKPGPVDQYLRRIHLAGGRHVDRIRIEEAGGDATTIVFRNSSEGDAPTAEERSRLEGR